ncbi:uncharacterized protein LOC123665542 [Melitaea cinxia]|uniref:uncharacterized protein LOC123665542 n=1 Tax=Melitaea cinxia TaxID=113334 RepID=UPI001E26FED1|nr:uncharacterized protein LOC123665542 [Melitaea cinxia]
MKKHNCRINVTDGVFKCGEEEIFILGGACGKVACVKKVIIPGRAEARVLVKLPTTGRKKSNRCVLIEDTPTKTSAQKLMTARTLVSGSSNAVVKVLNLDDRDICLNKGDVIGKCEEVVWMKKCSSMTGADLAKSNNYELVTELLDDCKSNLTYSQSMKAKKFLQRYANIFSSHEGDLGRTSVVQHRIDTGSERPIRQRARRIPIAKEKEVEGIRSVISAMLSPVMESRQTRRNWKQSKNGLPLRTKPKCGHSSDCAHTTGVLLRDSQR